MTVELGKARVKRIPIQDGFFSEPLFPLDQVRMKGRKCRSCCEIFLGKKMACDACQSTDMEEVVLSNQGKLYSYTIIRNKPPGDYKGPDPFIPFALGMVELPEGLILLSPLADCDFEKIEIGMELELVVEKLFMDEDDNEVIAYKFRPL